MTVEEVVNTLDEMVEKRPTNPEWWDNYGNKAISLAVMIIRRWQNIASKDNWVDLEEIEKEETR